MPDLEGERMGTRGTLGHGRIIAQGVPVSYSDTDYRDKETDSIRNSDDRII